MGELELYILEAETRCEHRVAANRLPFAGLGEIRQTPD